MIIKEIVYVDMDDVLCDFSGARKEALEKCPEMKYPQAQYGFFKNLKPMFMAVEALNVIRHRYDVYILTAPSVMNPLCYTEKRLWIEEHFGMEMVNKLIISPNKGLNKGRYLIDDNSSGRGQESFEGELIEFGNETFGNWQDVVHYLMVENGKKKI